MSIIICCNLFQVFVLFYLCYYNRVNIIGGRKYSVKRLTTPQLLFICWSAGLYVLPTEQLSSRFLQLYLTTQWLDCWVQLCLLVWEPCFTHSFLCSYLQCLSLSPSPRLHCLPQWPSVCASLSPPFHIRSVFLRCSGTGHYRHCQRVGELLEGCISTLNNTTCFALG